MGIELEIVGGGAGNASAAPERLLPSYDLVFAKARCAMEAIATGCAVILSDNSGLGTLVTRAGVVEQRRWNFGFRLLQRQISPESIMEEIQRYDSRDAAEVSAYIRENAGLDNALKQYLTIYRLVLDEKSCGLFRVDVFPYFAGLDPL